MKETDVLILGAGPVGLFTAFYCGMRGLSTIVVDQLPEIGGQLVALYPEKKIYDVAGFNEIKAKDLIKELRLQIDRFSATTEFMLDTEVTDIIKAEEFQISTTKESINAKTVIIAAGNGGFSPRKFGIENEEQFTNIDYFIKNKEIYKEKNVAIFGGGDSAVDFALMLEPLAKEVSIIHRRDEFRAHDYSIKLLKDSSINILTPYTLNQIEGENNLAKKIVIKSKAGDVKKIEIDNIICNYGVVSKLGAIEKIGLQLEKQKIVVDTFGETNIPGIMAVGDICTYPGKESLIIVGFGEVPIAVNTAYKHIYPNSKIGTIHSSKLLGDKDE